METLKTLAEKLKSIKEVKVRDTGQKFVTYNYEELGALGTGLQSCVRDAHDDELPNDFIYSIVDDCLDYIINEDIESIDTFTDSDVYYQSIESSVPSYNNELIEWLRGDLRRAEYLNEHVSDFGAPAEFNLFELIGLACARHITAIYNTLAQSLSELADEQNSEENCEVVA